MYKEMYYNDDLVNLSEEIVFEQLHYLIEDGTINGDSSEVAIQDIVAIALNNIPAKYVCSILEKAHPEQSLLDDVNDLKTYAKRQLLKAKDRVLANPHD